MYGWRFAYQSAVATQAQHDSARAGGDRWDRLASRGLARKSIRALYKKDGACDMSFIVQTPHMDMDMDMETPLITADPLTGAHTQHKR